MRPRKDRERNRAALLEAGRTVFAERGVTAPLETVAAQAGFSSATLYRHFETRDLLLLEVYVRTLGDYVDHARGLAGGDPWTAFIDHTHWVFDRLHADRTLLPALVTRPPHDHPEFDRARTEATRALNDLVSRAQAAGRFKSQRSSEDVVLFFTAADALVQHDDASSQRLFDLMLDSVGTAPSR